MSDRIFFPLMIMMAAMMVTLAVRPAFLTEQSPAPPPAGEKPEHLYSRGYID